MDKIIKASRWLINNPSLFFKHLIVQVKKLLPLPKSPVTKRMNGVSFEFDFGYGAAIRSMYTGGYELDAVEVMKSVLKKGDTFIDVGANIGYISCIGVGLVGKSGQVHSFEPVPEYCNRLKNMAKMNPDYKIIVNQCALGDKPGEASIRVGNDRNIGWNTMVFLSEKKEKVKEEFKVSVRRLSDYIKEAVLDKIALIKIDVEGFEFPVLKGLREYLESAASLPVIICEVASHAYPIMGNTLAELLEFVKKYNYKICSLVNVKREVDIINSSASVNVVFMPLQK